MHDCCWAAQPSFFIARELLQRDKSVLFLHDEHGSTPLSYVTKKNWEQWNNFLQQSGIVDELFPEYGDRTLAFTELFDMEPNSRPVTDPSNALRLDVAKKIVNGEIDSEDAHLDDDDESVVMDTHGLRVELEQRRNSLRAS
jgi:hypothetical protein